MWLQIQNNVCQLFFNVVYGIHVKLRRVVTDVESFPTNSCAVLMPFLKSMPTSFFKDFSGFIFCIYFNLLTGFN